MRYWAFDVKALIADFNKNKRTLASIEEAITVCRGYLTDSVEEIKTAEIQKYLDQLELKRTEYEWWVDMVILGLNELPEVEREVLSLWLIDHASDRTILTATGIENGYELNRIKNIALGKFHDVVLPN